jgi:predicted DNA-binding transcriptional regulator AlpA
MNIQTKNRSIYAAFHNARALSDHALIRPRDAAAMLSISRKHLYALANRPDFPERVRISDRVVAWRVCDLENWIANASDNKQWGVTND